MSTTTKAKIARAAEEFIGAIPLRLNGQPLNSTATAYVEGLLHEAFYAGATYALGEVERYVEGYKPSQQKP